MVYSIYIYDVYGDIDTYTHMDTKISMMYINLFIAPRGITFRRSRCALRRLPKTLVGCPGGWTLLDWVLHMEVS